MAQLHHVLGVATLTVYGAMLRQQLALAGGLAVLREGTLDTALVQRGVWLWDEEFVLACFGRLGAEGRAAYAAMYEVFPGDFALPCCYAPFFAVLLRRARRQALARAALLAGVADVVENACALSLLRAYQTAGLRTAPPLVWWVGPVASLVKWLCLGAAVCGVLLGGCRRADAAAAAAGAAGDGQPRPKKA